MRDRVSDLGRAPAPRIAASDVLPSTLHTVSASAAFSLSRLNRLPHTIAVYASPRSSPSATQHSLPGGRYPLPAPVFHRLDRALFHKLAGCDWIRQSQHLVISGPTGVGKSWLACALGHKACREGVSVLYRRASRLFAELATARGEGRLPRMLATLERTKLLIIDDWGPEPLTAEQRRDLLEIADDRYEKGSLLVTSQVPVSRWHELVGDPTIGDALLDRIVHRAHRIELKGPSLRKRQAVGASVERDSAAVAG